MSESEKSLASILVFRLAGGGAEKIVMRLARLLEERKQLSRIYTGSALGDDKSSSQVIVLDSPRAAGAAYPLLRFVRADPARSFLLTANYAALAPPLRLVRPNARIVVRIASIVSTEMQALSAPARLRYRIVMTLATAFADSIVVQGKEMRNDLVRTFPWTRRKVCVIHNFIEPEIWEYRAGPSAIGHPYIFCAATFRPVKGFGMLLAAFARSPARTSRKLVIAGINSADPGFLELMREHGLSQSEVIRLGFVECPYNLVAGADLCVLTSRYEGFSNFLLEAAAFGKFIVATTCPGGNREFMATYRNSIGVPVDDIDSIAAALSAPRHDIPRETARSQLSQFEWNRVSARYLSVLFDEM